MSLQLDMLGNADPLMGLEINLPHHCQCGHDMLHVGAGSGPHPASLHCARRKRHCGWLSHESAKFLSAVIEHFGRPTTPIRVRVSRTHRACASSATMSASTVPHISAEKTPENAGTSKEEISP